MSVFFIRAGLVFLVTLDDIRLGLQNTQTDSLQMVKNSNECPGYDTKQSDGEVPVILELWGMQNTPSLPSLSGPLWPGVVALNCLK